VVARQIIEAGKPKNQKLIIKRREESQY